MKIQKTKFNLVLNGFKSIFWTGFAAYFFLVSSGCGASKAAKMNQAQLKQAYELSKPIVVRTSLDDKRPQWTNKTVFEQDGKLYFAGAFIDGADYAVTVRLANSEALKNAIQSISQFIRAEFSQYVQGSNSSSGQGIERHVEDGIAAFSKNVHVQGIRQTEIFYEELFSPSAMQPSYNVFVRLEMNKADYLKAKADVLQKLRDSFKDEAEIEAKQKAERLLQDLKDEIKSAT